MDIADTIIPNSDQLNADQLVAGHMDVTIESVDVKAGEQPVSIHLVGLPGNPFKPCKTVRKILVAAWGNQSAAYVGRRMRLYCDPKVRFGGAEVGGIRVSHLSHISEPLRVNLLTTRGKRSWFVVEPLPDVPPIIAVFEALIEAATTVAELDALATELKAADLGAHKGHLIAAWTARKTALAATPPADDDVLDAAREAEGE